MIAALITCGIGAGCDTKPARIEDSNGEAITMLAVDPTNQAELTAVTESEKARINYRFRTNILKAYYDSIGDADRYLWASSELKNLDEAMWFKWTGLPAIIPPAGESLKDTDPRLLVEYVIEARKNYKASMRNLQALYHKQRNADKATIVTRVIERLDPVRTYMYYFSAEAPGKNLKPIKVIPAAEQLYAQAYAIHKQGARIPGITSYKKQRRALAKFLELIELYPESTKSPLAAFYIGHIYREYFNENVRAVMWYERAWQWNPDIQIGARYQAAVVYDLRLHNFSRARQLYKDVLRYEHSIQSNRFMARRRIPELDDIISRGE